MGREEKERKGEKRNPGLKILIRSFCVNHILSYLAGESISDRSGQVEFA